MKLSFTVIVLVTISCALCIFTEAGPSQQVPHENPNWQQPGQVPQQRQQANPGLPPEIQALSQMPSFPDQQSAPLTGQQQIPQPLPQQNPQSNAGASESQPALQSQFLPPIYPLNPQPQNGSQNPYDVQQNFRVKQNGNRNEFNNVNARQGVASAAINRSFIAQSDNKNLANNVLLDQRQTGGQNLGWVVQTNNNNLANFANIRQIRAGEGEQFARIVQNDNWQSYNVAKTQQAFKNTNYGNIAVNTKMQGLKTQALAVKTQYIDLRKNKEMREKVAKMLGIPVPPDEDEGSCQGQDGNKQPPQQPEPQAPPQPEPQPPQQPESQECLQPEPQPPQQPRQPEPRQPQQPEPEACPQPEPQPPQQLPQPDPRPPQLPPQLPPRLPPQLPPQLPPRLPPQLPPQLPPRLPPQLPPQLPPRLPPQLPPQPEPQPQQSREPCEKDTPPYPFDFKPNTFEGPATVPISRQFPNIPISMPLPPNQQQTDPSFILTKINRPTKISKRIKNPSVNKYYILPDDPNSYIQQVADVIEPNDFSSRTISVGAAK